MNSEIQINNTLKVIAAIIIKGTKIFIARRGPNKHLAGFWEFPGGKIEADETSEECLKRELEEELGVKIVVESFFMENVHEYGNIRILLKAYICEHVSGQIILKDHDKFLWVEKTELGNYLFAPADVPFINALNG